MQENDGKKSFYCAEELRKENTIKWEKGIKCRLYKEEHGTSSMLTSVSHAKPLGMTTTIKQIKREQQQPNL